MLVGPTLAEKLGHTTGWGAPFEWAWLVLQWPLVFALVATGIGLLYYFGPDAGQDWVDYAGCHRPHDSLARSVGSLSSCCGSTYLESPF